MHGMGGGGGNRDGNMDESRHFVVSRSATCRNNTFKACCEYFLN